MNAPRFNTSFYLLGWTPNTYDAHNSLYNLAGTRDGVRGMFNNGGYSNPALDTLIDQIAVETNPARRQELITQTSNIIRDDAVYIPLHQQQVVWAARNTVQLQQQADNGLPAAAGACRKLTEPAGGSCGAPPELCRPAPG